MALLLDGLYGGELELELIQSHMAQKPVLRGEVGCACVARGKWAKQAETLETIIPYIDGPYAGDPGGAGWGFCLLFGRVFPDPLDLDFGVTGAGPAERKERAVADMLRAEKKKVELPLGLSQRVCFADCRFA